MIIWYILLGIFLLIFLLLLFPVGVDVAFREEFSLTLRYLFLRFPLLPGKASEEGEKPEKDEEKKEKRNGESGADKLKGMLSRHGLGGFLDSLFEAVGYLTSSTKKILSHLKLKRFDLYLCLGGEPDAAEGAIRYGQVSGAVYSACGALFALMPCRKKGVTVDLNYQSGDDLVDFSARLSVRPIHVVKEGLVLLVKELLVLKRLMGPGRKGAIARKEHKIQRPAENAGSQKKGEIQ